MVVEEEVDGQVMPKGCQGEGLEGGKELSSLLCQYPGRAREEAGAHALLPDADKEDAPGRLRSISKVAGRVSRGGFGEGIGAPGWEGHSEGL